MRKLLFFLVLIIGLGVGFSSYFFYQYNSLSEYNWDRDRVVKDGVVYLHNKNLTNDYLKDQIQSEKTIGSFKGDSFWGLKSWIYKLKNVNENECILITGPMYEGVYLNESANE